VNNHIGDTNKKVSDTPRLVDQILLSEKNDWTADLYRVGCDLQRELTAAQDRIKRLEEAGNQMELVLISFQIFSDFRKSDSIRASLNWHKAKEAKP
jgi:hypothetical protein